MISTGFNNHKSTPNGGVSEKTFYRGIVVKNNDPALRNRVKIFVSEINTQPLDDWYTEFDNIRTKIGGVNLDSDNWNDSEVFEEIASKCCWAEPCYPLMGESGDGRYNKGLQKSTISDSNYPESFPNLELIKDSSGNLKGGFNVQKGSFAPAALYDMGGYDITDAFGGPSFGKANPYSCGYHPNKSVNKTKGSFGIPEVGSKVWVFYENGDTDFPVYFGVYRNTRELLSPYGLDNVGGVDVKTSRFEN